MSEKRKTVFVSCGQFTEEERSLGRRASELIHECTPFEGYFAENQTTLDTLTENVLRRLYESVGLVVIMHHRGTVETPRGRLTRASVWVEQEVAVATLMQQILKRPLHVALFIQKGIAIEGIRQQIQLNPIEFTTNDEVVSRLREILPKWTEPLYIGDEERRKLVDSVDLSIRSENGHHRNYTIQVENHSRFDAEVTNISLWSGNQRVSKLVAPPDNVRWSVPGQRSVPIQFDAKEDVAYRLWQLAGSPHDFDPRSGAKLLGSARQFQIEVRVALRCEILGLERDFEESRTVQVDFVNRQTVCPAAKNVRLTTWRHGHRD
jgi:hypothetical protein